MGQVQRRQILIAAGALLAAPFASAQQPQKMRRIGFLSAVTAGSPFQKQMQQNFSLELGQAGYEEGKNLTIEWRFSDGKEGSLIALANELVQLKVELIVGLNDVSIMAASRATRTIPIVMWNGNHPVESGWVKTLARPGGNITGVLWADPEQAAKALEILKEAAPRAVRVAVTFNPTFPFAQRWLAGYDRDAKVLGLALQYFPITRPEEVGPALDRVAAARPDALFVSTESVQASQARKMADFAIEQKLILVSNAGLHVDAGGLVSNQPDPQSQRRRAVSYVDRILRGARPADLPVEMPTKFELVINGKTARAIGYTVPPSLLARADRIIE